MADWRVGTHYGVHVYEGQNPVATFFNSVDATEAVAAVNNQRKLGKLTSVDFDEDFELIGEALGCLLFKNPARRDEIVEMCNRTGVMINVD